MINFADARQHGPSKTALMSDVTRAPKPIDPLDQRDLSPAKKIPHWGSRGDTAGTVGGFAAGGVAGALLPPLLGAAMGHALGSGAESLTNSGGHHMEAGVPDPHASWMPTTGAIAGGLAGLPFVPGTAFVGAAQGGVTGGQIGRAAGRGVEGLYGAHRRGVERVRRMSPPEAYAYLRAKERMGGNPEEVAGMRQAYNIRRESLRDQISAGVL